MRKENNEQCREKNEKLCKVKACRKINLHYDQKLQNNCKTSFWKSRSIFLKKLTYTHGPFPLLLLNEHTFLMNPIETSNRSSHYLNHSLCLLVGKLLRLNTHRFKSSSFSVFVCVLWISNFNVNGLRHKCFSVEVVFYNYSVTKYTMPMQRYIVQEWLLGCLWPFSYVYKIWKLKSLVTIRMNETFPCLACCGQKLYFYVQKSRQR